MVEKKTERKKGKIVNLLIVYMLVVGVLPLVISGYFLISYNANTLDTYQQQLHLQICKSIASDVSLFVGSCIYSLVPLEKSLEFNFDPNKPDTVFNDPNTTRLLKALFDSDNRLMYIGAVNNEGRGVHVGDQPADGSELSDELHDAFDICVKQQLKYVHTSNPLILEKYDQPVPVFVVGKSVMIENTIRGMVVVVYSLQEIQDSIRRISYSGNTTLLLNSKGEIILHPDLNLVKRKVALTGSPIYQELKKLKSMATSTVPFIDTTSGHAVGMVGTVYMIPDPNFSWGVVVQTHREIANREIQNMIRKTVIWIMISTFFALLMSYIFSLRISTPIETFTEKTLSISKGNFSERVDIRSNNELGILADNFNLMAEEVQDYIDRLKKAYEENREMFLGIIRTLAAAIDAKDPYTRGHSERVTRYSEMIAVALGLPSEDIEKIEIAALLHDVGKIGISDTILRKPSMLTEEEYGVMKQHPELGGNIMGQIHQLEDIIPGMRYHHESLDGTGYPRGLKGDQIPLAARIIGVADAFDAMTTDRPYQQTFTPDLALERIRSLAGKRFDTQVVMAFLQAYQKYQAKQPSNQKPAGNTQSPKSS